ncbi:glycerol-3-phosphate acyltransferase 1-like [Cucurbita moschata]|uniref:Glycerol-3-phosphate acyltransferase 1-like n=2 Tax=Cucurbita TaxID=3660 RepID=A0A6J1GMJ0_CUCMO|nr:glycerol-3-phosphate acyltransferase 1-like [Cucurbita moschata]
MAVLPRFVVKLIDCVIYQLLANSCYKAAKKVRQYGFLFTNPSLKTPNQHPSFYPHVSKCSLQNRASQTLVCDLNGALLSSSKNYSFFPYFMLVAFEGGSLFRAIILLLSWPILCLLDWDAKFKAMIFISFCGLPTKNMASVSSAVLPKFFLDNLNLHAFEVFQATGSRIVFTSVPRVMVEGFLRNYLNVNDVIGTELQTFGRYYTGLVSENGLLVKHKALIEYFGDKKPDIGIGSPNLHDHLFISLCKEAYVVSKEDNKGQPTPTSTVISRQDYPKPLIFHDGRLAFLPTPFASVCTFLWIPFGVLLAIYRICIGSFLPYKMGLFLSHWSGLRITLKGYTEASTEGTQKRILFVCSHRTLLDPVVLSASVGKPLVAATYSVSRFSEIISPIKTVRLTRDREKDGAEMQKLLSEGDLVVCPEGTTCREPYLLRFSPLFAELSDEIVPVGVKTWVSMFYGTTASGLKWLDPIMFLMNPRASYDMVVLPKLPKEMTCGGGGKSSYEVANYVQRQLGDVLGFECTKLTRKDKYLMLAGNSGLVAPT